MKTEMAMLPNGNYESVVSFIQHECFAECHLWSCKQTSNDLGKLILCISDGDPYEDGYEKEIEVNFCPFCGYSPKKIDKLTL